MVDNGEKEREEAEISDEERWQKKLDKRIEETERLFSDLPERKKFPDEPEIGGHEKQVDEPEL